MRKLDWTVLGLIAVGALSACGSSDDGNEAAEEATANVAANAAESTALPETNLSNAAEAIEANEAAAVENESTPTEEETATPAAKAPEPAAAAKAPPAETAAVERPASFAMCATCHSTGKGEAHKIGPNLFAVVGSKAGAKPGYAYSDAMKAASITWTPAQIHQFLIAPSAMVPGTKMMMPGMKDEAKRAEVIRYLSSLK